MVIASNANIKILGGHYIVADSSYVGNIIIKNDTSVVIDGDSVFASGKDSMGYLIYIHNSRKITIKNFWSAKSYFYAIHADSSTDITIENCNFSANRKDTVGNLWITDDESQADGGGVCFSYVGKSAIINDTMQYENDGVAAYNCYGLSINNNILSWNTAYGIRFWHSDSSSINYNDCSNTNRATPQSDCGDLLLDFCKNNVVIHNNCSYGGDGIFTNSDITRPNAILNFHDHNYFAYNYCSYSPNNAIESVFTDSNVFRHNIASYSNYGIWGGYAINSIIDSNEFNNNFTNGVAIEHGLYNTVSNDSVIGNGAIGINFFASSPVIIGYGNRHSSNEKASGNYIANNALGIEFWNTDSSNILSNLFYQNAMGIEFDSNAISDSIHLNTFSRNVSYDIRNNSPQNINARHNDYQTTDTAVIDCKVFDHFDSVPDGIVTWNPYTISAGTVFQYNPPWDLCEPGLAQWGDFVSDGAPTALSWDYTTFVSGVSSLKCVTSSGFQVRLHYYPANDSIASWNLTGVTDIFISFKDIDTNIYGYQQQSVRIGDDCGNYYEYDPAIDTVFHTNWTTYDIPITGSAGWIRTMVGNPSLSDITYAEVIGDTWGYGFTLWVDGFHFYPQPTNTSVNDVTDERENVKIYPNPNNGKFTVICHSEQGEESLPIIEIYNVLGERVQTETLRDAQGDNLIELSNVPNGVYFYRIITNKGDLQGVGKFIIAR